MQLGLFVCLSASIDLVFIHNMYYTCGPIPSEDDRDLDSTIDLRIILHPWEIQQNMPSKYATT